MRARTIGAAKMTAAAPLVIRDSATHRSAASFSVLGPVALRFPTLPQSRNRLSENAGRHVAIMNFELICDERSSLQLVFVIKPVAVDKMIDVVQFPHGHSWAAALERNSVTWFDSHLIPLRM